MKIDFWENYPEGTMTVLWQLFWLQLAASGNGPTTRLSSRTIFSGSPSFPLFPEALQICHMLCEILRDIQTFCVCCCNSQQQRRKQRKFLDHKAVIITFYEIKIRGLSGSKMRGTECCY